MFTLLPLKYSGITQSDGCWWTTLKIYPWRGHHLGSVRVCQAVRVLHQLALRWQKESSFLAQAIIAIIIMLLQIYFTLLHLNIFTYVTLQVGLDSEVINSQYYQLFTQFSHRQWWRLCSPLTSPLKYTFRSLYECKRFRYSIMVDRIDNNMHLVFNSSNLFQTWLWNFHFQDHLDSKQCFTSHIQFSYFQLHYYTILYYTIHTIF